MSNNSLKLSKSQKAINARFKKFWHCYCMTQDLVESYRYAGYKAKNDKQARINGYLLLKKFDRKLDFNKVLDSQGISDRFLARELKKVIKSKDYKEKLRGIALAAKAKGHLKGDSGPGIGVKIVIGSQDNSKDNRTIDVTPDTKALPESITITD